MTLRKKIQDEHLKNIGRGLTFEASDKNEETTIDEKAKNPKRNMERARPVRTARPDRG